VNALEILGQNFLLTNLTGILWQILLVGGLLGWGKVLFPKEENPGLAALGTLALFLTGTTLIGSTPLEIPGKWAAGLLAIGNIALLLKTKSLDDPKILVLFLGPLFLGTLCAYFPIDSVDDTNAYAPMALKYWETGITQNPFCLRGALNFPGSIILQGISIGPEPYGAIATQETVLMPLLAGTLLLGGRKRQLHGYEWLAFGTLLLMPRLGATSAPALSLATALAAIWMTLLKKDPSPWLLGCLLALAITLRVYAIIPLGIAGGLWWATNRKCPWKTMLIATVVLAPSLLHQIVVYHTPLPLKAFPGRINPSMLDLSAPWPFGISNLIESCSLPTTLTLLLLWLVTWQSSQKPAALAIAGGYCAIALLGAGLSSEYAARYGAPLLFSGALLGAALLLQSPQESPPRSLALLFAAFLWLGTHQTEIKLARNLWDYRVLQTPPTVSQTTPDRSIAEWCQNPYEQIHTNPYLVLLDLPGAFLTPHSNWKAELANYGIQTLLVTNLGKPNWTHQQGEGRPTVYIARNKNFPNLWNPLDLAYERNWKPNFLWWIHEVQKLTADSPTFQTDVRVSLKQPLR
jgi:hypothetical protein